MINVDLGQFIPVMRDFAAFLQTKTQRKAGAALGELHFYNSGMHGTLKALAAGEVSQAKLDKLKEQLNASAPEVDQIFSELSMVLATLQSGGGSKVRMASEIDEVLNGSFGKSAIRERIGQIASKDLQFPYARENVVELAKEVCNEVRLFNDRVIKIGEEAENWGRDR